MTAPNGPTPDALFANPRHFRGDCRRLRAAVRRGWLDGAPAAVLDALEARAIHAANLFEHHPCASGTRVRGTLALAWLAIELVRRECRAANRPARRART